MAARKRSLSLNEEWRTKIQISMLINRLNDHIFNGKRLEATQLKAIEILLRKVAPDLAQVDSTIHIIEQPEARVYPLGLPQNEQVGLPAPSEAMDSVH